MKLAQIRLVTHDVPRLTRFYAAVTGMTPDGNERYVEFLGPEPVLAISSQPMIDLQHRGATIPGINRALILDFEVANVDAERERLRAIVRDIVMEPTTQSWGNRSMLFRDPDGNLINMFTPAEALAKA